MKTENVKEFLKAGKKSIKGLQGRMLNEISLSMKDKKIWDPTGKLTDISALGLVLKIERKDKPPEWLLYDWAEIDHISWTKTKKE